MTWTPNVLGGKPRGAYGFLTEGEGPDFLDPLHLENIDPLGDELEQARIVALLVERVGIAFSAGLVGAASNARLTGLLK